MMDRTVYEVLSDMADGRFYSDYDQAVTDIDLLKNELFPTNKRMDEVLAENKRLKKDVARLSTAIHGLYKAGLTLPQTPEMAATWFAPMSNAKAAMADKP